MTSEQSIPEFVTESEVRTPPQKTAELGALVGRADQLELYIEGVSRELEQARGELKALLEQSIPDKMDEIGTNVFGIPNTDRECRVRPYYHAVLPSADKDPELRETGLSWLLQNYGDVVKHTLTIEFNREEHDKAARVAKRIEQMLAEEEVSQDTVVQKSFGVHWKTLTSLVKELYESGAEVPLLCLGATVGRVAQLVKRKVK